MPSEKMQSIQNLIDELVSGYVESKYDEKYLKEKINEILEKNKTIAVVGCSRDPEKEAHKIPKFMQEHGYKIIPVNPSAEEILGEKVYKSLSEIKEDRLVVKRVNFLFNFPDVYFTA